MNYPLSVYRAELEERARQKLGYQNPLSDQRHNQAIRKAIDDKVEEKRREQERYFDGLVQKAKKVL